MIKMRVLELFSGTESFSKVAEERGHRTFTVDIEPKFKPDLCKDVMDLNTSDIPFIPNVIWSSPPCEQYSHAKRSGERDIDRANKNVLKTLEIIGWFPKALWIIENPQTGLLKKQSFMRELPFIDVSYCKYGLPYRKQTRLWTNLKFRGKVCRNDCNFMVMGLKRKRHIGSAGCGGRGQGHKIRYTDKCYKKEDKYVVPKVLCLEICLACERYITGTFRIPPLD